MGRPIVSLIQEINNIPTSGVGNLVNDYGEDWTTLVFAAAATWTLVNVGLGANKVVRISIQSIANNQTVGVRYDGSSNVRTQILSLNSVATYITKTNASGEVELYQTAAANTIFKAAAILGN